MHLMSDPTATTDDRQLPGGDAEVSARRDSFMPGKHVLCGPVGQLASETRPLLRQRLRAAVIVLVVGFGLFFIRSVILHRHHVESLAVAFQGAMLGLLVLAFGVLSSRRGMSLHSFEGSKRPSFCRLSLSSWQLNMS